MLDKDYLKKVEAKVVYPDVYSPDAISIENELVKQKWSGTSMLFMYLHDQIEELIDEVQYTEFASRSFRLGNNVAIIYACGNDNVGYAVTMRSDGTRGREEMEGWQTVYPFKYDWYPDTEAEQLLSLLRN